MLKSVTVYCGSRNGTDPAYLASAAEFGRSLARAGLTLVYGGANVGLMGALANAALAAGGRVVGVIPENLVSKEIAHPTLTDLIVVSSMHERKTKLFDLGDAFVALPGGAGTMDEWFEVFTWAQIGIHAKPIGILNHRGYYDSLLGLLTQMEREGFSAKEHRNLYCVATEAATLLDALRSFRPPPLGDPAMDRRAPEPPR